MIDGGEKLKNSPGKLKKMHGNIVSYWGIWLVLIIVIVFFGMKNTDVAPDSHIGIETVEASAPPVFGEPEHVGSKRCKDCHRE